MTSYSPPLVSPAHKQHRICWPIITECFHEQFVRRLEPSSTILTNHLHAVANKNGYNLRGLLMQVAWCYVQYKTRNDAPIIKTKNTSTNDKTDERNDLLYSGSQAK